MFKETLLVRQADNGGAVHAGGGANAYPLRGGHSRRRDCHCCRTPHLLVGVSIAMERVCHQK